jgi:HK97 family phage portal protein
MKVANYIRQKMREWVVGNLRLVDPRFYEAMADGGPSHSGHTVNVNTALQLSAVWSCVRLISETAATLPLVVYRTDEAGRKVAAKDHPLYPILHDQPSWDMTAAEFWECQIASMTLWGNAYALKTYTPRGKLTSLDPLRPDWMSVTRNRAGRIIYRYNDPDVSGNKPEYTEDQVFHLKGFGMNGLEGLSPISYARHSMGNAMAVEESVGSTFRNMIRPSGVLTTDQVLTKQQQEQYLGGLADKFSGTINAGKVMPLMAGFKYQPISLPPEDAQMLQTRGFHVEEVCRWFRVPPHMIGHTERQTSWGTGMEQQMLGFLIFALRPYLTRIEQAIRKSLISPTEWGRVSAEFNLEGLLRADSHGRAEFYGAMVEKGLMTRNEIRAKENLPPLPGGDRLTVQVNMTFLDLLGTTAAVPSPANQTTPAMEAAPT